ncbi:zinc finger protein 90 homolog [Contarinia nasturtii]|uniref:zinc finger protein 90 homolog n=1 Tax=Contarinia nasturtii TaxID=265458 RepID=UPI0012D429AD|nr:zinc finger protein 90 homolog [Contarinia nasturtii]
MSSKHIPTVDSGASEECPSLLERHYMFNGCNFCTQTFSTETNFRYHKCHKFNSSRERIPTTSDLLNKRLKLKMQAKSMGLSSKEYNQVHQCNFCYEIFVNETNFKEHMQMHIMNEMIECDICEKRHVRQDEADEHRLNHFATDIMQCKYCPLNFKYRQNLWKHEVTHKWIESIEIHSPLECSPSKLIFQSVDYQTMPVHDQSDSSQQMSDAEIDDDDDAMILPDDSNIATLRLSEQLMDIQAVDNELQRANDAPITIGSDRIYMISSDFDSNCLYPIKCDFCDETFEDYYQKRNHECFVHLELRVELCPIEYDPELTAMLEPSTVVLEISDDEIDV